ncbi:MAG: hypothetical protein JSV50_05180 [Desulfobacteraceae bacterium]|nr:MAG: hypothetical protein JSV50_05180 [Desulfobacteraceae bacterium]
MKSKVLVKLVLIFLLASGVVVFLGSKIMVSAMDGPSPFIWSNGSVYDAYGARVNFDRLYPFPSSYSDLLVEPKLTPTLSFNTTVESAIYTPILPPLNESVSEYICYPYGGGYGGGYGGYIWVIYY